LFGRVIYPSEKENGLERLKTALKKAARFRTPPKTFSFRSLSDFPRLLLNGCKDGKLF
jgi:hypothetical protein